MLVVERDKLLFGYYIIIKYGKKFGVKNVEKSLCSTCLYYFNPIFILI